MKTAKMRVAESMDRFKWHRAIVFGMPKGILGIGGGDLSPALDNCIVHFRK